MGHNSQNLNRTNIWDQSLFLNGNPQETFFLDLQLKIVLHYTSLQTFANKRANKSITMSYFTRKPESKRILPVWFFCSPTVHDARIPQTNVIQPQSKTLFFSSKSKFSSILTYYFNYFLDALPSSTLKTLSHLFCSYLFNLSLSLLFLILLSYFSVTNLSHCTPALKSTVRQ